MELLRDLIPVAYRTAVLDYVGEWRMAEAGLRRYYPDALEFAELIESTGVAGPTLHLAANYVSRCVREGKTPDANHLIDLLLKWLPPARTQ